MHYDDGTDKTYHADQVHALQPGHLHQPAPDRRSGRACQGGRRSWPTARRPIKGEIALGKNALIGFMTWEGYNYEDAVLLNEQSGTRRRLHLHPHRGVRDPKPAIPSSDPRRSPATSRTSARTRSSDLDERGIIRVGAEVRCRRHSGRQGHAEGRDRADRRGAPAPRDLRREGARGPRYLSACAARRIRYRRRRQGIYPRERRRAAARRQQGRPLSISRRSERSPSAIRWRAATATRVSFPAFCRRRICRSWRTARRSTSC